MRVDEGRNGWNLPAVKTKARAVVGRAKQSLLSDPGSELRLGREKKRGKVRMKIIENISKEKKV